MLMVLIFLVHKKMDPVLIVEFNIHSEALVRWSNLLIMEVSHQLITQNLCTCLSTIVII